jgi:hypothetical protein
MTFQKILRILGIIVAVALGIVALALGNLVVEYLHEKNFSLVVSEVPPSLSADIGTDGNFSSIEDGFAIKFPSKPTTTSQDEYISEGISMQFSDYFTRKNGALYLVQVSDISDFSFPPDALNKLNLQGVVDNMISGGDGEHVISQSEVNISGYKGIKYFISITGGYIDGFTFHDSSKLYTVGIHYSVGTEPSQNEIDDFISSFRLIQ